MKITLEVKKATVLLTYAADQIQLILDLPTPFPEMKFEAQARIDARYDYGEQWCKENLGITPEIINSRPKEQLFSKKI